MRKPDYLSPSSKSRWFENRSGFYLKYLVTNRLPREPQAEFMGVGSGFDARVKSEIMQRCYGKPMMKGTQYDLETLFEAQVEPHNRDMAWEVSDHVWNAYVTSGALDDLWGSIEKSPCAPLMEDRVQGEIAGVPLLGLPDLIYVDGDSLLKVITDFKVLGSRSKPGGGASPPAGYMIVRDGWKDKPSNTNGKPHKKFEATKISGKGIASVCPCDIEPGEMEIGDAYMEDINSDWAEQMSTYAWLMGSKVGAEDFVVRIECAACRHPKNGMRVKWAKFMNRVSRQHQIMLIKTYQQIWKAIEDEHIFTDFTKEESQERCEVLEMQADFILRGEVHGPLKGIGRDNTNSWMRIGL